MAEPPISGDARHVEIEDLSEIDQLDATPEQQIMNRFLRLKAEEIMAVVGAELMPVSGYLSSATNGDSDPIRV
jgi:hypothetical protein